MMKKLLFPLLCLLFSLTALAGEYKVSEIPNVQLADSTRFVSNPDGILSPAVEAQINERLRQLRTATTAEVAVVAVDDIDPNAEIDDFATNLFRAWGLGRKDTNNGLLILLVRNRRQVTVRTGGGLEGLLPDGLIGAINRAEMLPRFRENDYDGGILAGVNTFSDILSSDEARAEITSRYESRSPGLFTIYLWFCGGLAALLLLIYIGVLLRSAKLDRYGRYKAIDRLYTPALFCTFLGLGMPLIALIPIMITRHSLRRGTHLCHNCGTKMKLVNEQQDNDYLTHVQDLEEKIGAVDYDVWLCPKCAETEIIPYEQRSSQFEECPVCHGKTLRVVSDRITQPATEHSTGLRTITRRCLNCGFDDDQHITLPRREVPKVVVIPGAGFGGPGGGGFGGGSFGGGFTAGGGTTSSW